MTGRGIAEIVAVFGILLVAIGERGLRILMTETGLEAAAASALLEDAEHDLRIALVMHRAKVGRDSAERALEGSAFVVDDAVMSLRE